ncbi:MAG: prepilin-type N-terminal cleavage/methylation domain-containing protein [Kiritimatiellae bacterium]|nr:prepilin-type N-terminal cleavage/methylation domain-containing protein [Kiritimatiellia bacterium]
MKRVASVAIMRALRRARGFSLVEVSLALLVVSVGILGAFALIPAGLSTNRIAIEETQSAMFAETVFNAVRAQAQAGLWNNIADRRLTVDYPGTSGRAMYSSAQNIRPPQIFPLVVKAEANSNIADLALKYRMAVTDPVPGKVKRITLEVWPGEFPNTGSNTNAYLFCTDILNTAP